MTDEEIIRWFRNVDPSTSKPQSYSELSSIKFPQFIIDDIDRSYMNGVMDCAEMFLSMYRKGYVRATEIYNTLMEWKHCRSMSPWDRLDNFHEKIQNWSKIRRKVLARCNHKCTICGSDDKLEVHHIVSVSNGGTMNLQNLTAVCFNCHRERNDETADKNAAIHSKRSR